MSHLRAAADPAPRRLSWRRYLITLGVIVLVGVAAAVPLILTGDEYRTHYTHVAGHRARPVAMTADQVRPAWSHAGPAPSGDPVVADTVVTADRHGVTGRDPSTGTARWRYERSGTHLCRWAVQGTTVLTVFADGTDCSDLTGFDAATGKRLFYLNADLPAGIRLVPGPVVFLAYTHSDVTAFYVDGGNQAWTFHRNGCSVADAASGELGAFVIARCSTSGDELMSIDAYNGKQKWQHPLTGADPAILSATGKAATVTRRGSAHAVSFFGEGGLPDGELHPPPMSGAGPVSWAAAQLGGQIVTYAGGRVLVLDPGGQRLAWSAPATGPALVAGNVVLVPTRSGFVEYAPSGRRGATVGASVPGPLSALGRVRDEVVTVGAGRTTAYA